MEPESWKKRVYHPSMKETHPVDWEIVSKAAKKRDRNQCRSCGLRVGLTVHHIEPRESGGGYHLENLVTLCRHCHDEIEELGLKNIVDIDGYKKRKYIKKATKSVTNETPVRWQQWVYGGYSNPNG